MRIPQLNIKGALHGLRMNEALVDYVTTLKQNYRSASSLAHAYEDQWQSNRCVFVLSTGRTGTMQLAALLNLSPDIMAFHEPFPQLYKASLDAYEQRCSPDISQHVVRAARDELIAQATHHRQIYVETNNRLTLLADTLTRAFPSSQFIHLHRHPWEVIRSGMTRRWYNGSHLDPFRIAPRPDDPFFNNWHACSPIEKTAWFWSYTNQSIRDFLRQLPTDRWFELHAQALFKNDLETIQALFAFLGVSSPSKVDIAKTLSRRLNAHVKHTHPPIQNLPTSSQNDIWPIVSDVADALGYTISTRTKAVA